MRQIEAAAFLRNQGSKSSRFIAAIAYSQFTSLYDFIYRKTLAEQNSIEILIVSSSMARESVDIRAKE